jgi:protein gp37
MSGKSKIEWTESTWNPVTGCTKISDGCANCYAERLAKRLKAMGQPNYQNGFEVTMHERMLDYPSKIKIPQTIFVNSMSDLFHEKIPLEYIQRVFNVMEKAHWHQFQVLTKRAERLAELAQSLNWSPNIWMGVTVENSECLHRIDFLRTVNAQVRFLSIEPLLSSLPSLDLSGIDWVIVGGESGPGARPMQADWVREIRGNCIDHSIPFFFKQWGGINKKQSGKILDGRTWEEKPNSKIKEPIILAL